MKRAQSGLSPATSKLFIGIAALAALAAMAADKTALADAQARYQQQRAVCLSGQSNHDRATCLKEADAALARAKRGGPDDATPVTPNNATKRCDALPDLDRQACLKRMQGQGSTSGSAAGGGILRELVTPEVAVPATPNPGIDAPAVPAK